MENQPEMVNSNVQALNLMQQFENPKEISRFIQENWITLPEQIPDSIIYSRPIGGHQPAYLYSEGAGGSSWHMYGGPHGETVPENVANVYQELNPDQAYVNYEGKRYRRVSGKLTESVWEEDFDYHQKDHADNNDRISHLKNQLKERLGDEALEQVESASNNWLGALLVGCLKSPDLLALMNQFSDDIYGQVSSTNLNPEKAFNALRAAQKHLDLPTMRDQ